MDSLVNIAMTCREAEPASKIKLDCPMTRFPCILAESLAELGKKGALMIYVTGIGPGDPSLILQAARKEMLEAELIIGSKRQLQILPEEARGERRLLPKFGVLEDLLRKNIDRNICLLASGDPLFFGIGSWISRKFDADQYTIIPGLSSVAYLFSRLGLSMNDAYLSSSHGRQPDWARILSSPKVGMVTDDQIGPYQIAQKALAAGYHQKIYIGENLSYPEEQLSCLAPAAVEDRAYEPNVVLLLHEDKDA